MYSSFKKLTWWVFRVKKCKWSRPRQCEPELCSERQRQRTVCQISCGWDWPCSSRLSWWARFAPETSWSYCWGKRRAKSRGQRPRRATKAHSSCFQCTNSCTAWEPSLILNFTTKTASTLPSGLGVSCPDTRAHSLAIPTEIDCEYISSPLHNSQSILLHLGKSQSSVLITRPCHSRPLIRVINLRLCHHRQSTSNWKA